LNEENGYSGESFPFLIRMEEKIEDPLGMLSKIRWEAAHLGKACV
jgi:hypothetical protein